MGIRDALKRNRAGLAAAIGAGRYESFSAANFSRMRDTRKVIRRHAQGRVLDVGCGHMPFRRDLEALATRYEGFDVEARVPDVAHIGDVQAMTGMADAEYDTVCCFEVLEHVPRPARAMAEMARVLKPGGKLLLTVPHLSRLHEEPNDYFRYTAYGLRTLIDDAGLELLEINHYGGMLSFVSHQISTVLIGLVWPARVIREAVFLLNGAFLVWPSLWIDRVTDRSGLFALGHLAAARKPVAKC